MTGTATRKNRRLMIGLFAVVLGMTGLAYASVPLYRLFCQVTGYGGTTQVSDRTSATVTDRVVKVRFDSLTNGLPWTFQPVRREISVRVGENVVAYYRARNLSPEPRVGTATFNVTPLKAGRYFNKVACFCFTEQRLEAGQQIDMPVMFFIDPAIERDPNLRDLKTITLSYTFFPVENPRDALRDAPRDGPTARDLSRLAKPRDRADVN